MKVFKNGDYKMWLMVIAIFALLITAWTSLIIVANKNAPEKVEIQDY